MNQRLNPINLFGKTSNCFNRSTLRNLINGGNYSEVKKYILTFFLKISEPFQSVLMWDPQQKIFHYKTYKEVQDQFITKSMIVSEKTVDGMKIPPFKVQQWFFEYNDVIARMCSR